MNEISGHKEFREELQNQVKGEVFFDDYMRGVYSTDASFYQIMPVGVLTPFDDGDVINTVKLAGKFGVNILPRGSGTSLGGQAAGEAIVIDFTKYMNRVLEFNLKEKWVRVQPGIVLDELNAFLKPYKLHFAPDPATGNRATIGGMIGNNSSGARSILYGITRDHVLETKTLLPDGAILNFGELDIKEKSGLGVRESEILAGFESIIDSKREAIKTAYPKIMRRVQGYNLDSFVKGSSWNLSELITGSEGTLGIVLAAKLNLEPLPEHKILVAVHFGELRETIGSVSAMVEHGPSAVEILDEDLLRAARESPTTARLCDWIVGDPGGILVVEFIGDTEQHAREKAEKLVQDLRNRETGYAWPVMGDHLVQSQVWTVRKNGLGLISAIEGEAKPIGFIEDAAVPLEHLPDYIERILQYCKSLDVPLIMYAHASVGLIHVRPVLDLKQQEDIDKMKKIARQSFELVKKYNGSISGEHGDGRTRSPFLEEYFGKEVYAAFREVKQLFDPAGIMNPGVIVDPEPIDANLRFGPEYKIPEIETVYKYRKEGGFPTAVEKCTGVGVCRQNLGGLMCPSYRATRDEEHSTRGRANALRMTMTGELAAGSFTDPRLFGIMDLCLSCKGCKSECPSNVDVAKLKSEFLNKYREEHGTSARDRFVSVSTSMARRFSGWKAPLINRVQKTPVFRKLLERMVGVDSRRILPSYARKSFHKWFDGRIPEHPGIASTATAIDLKGNGTPKRVVLFDDTYMNCHEVNIGISAVELLESCGYEVILAKAGCCQRPSISHGFLEKAKKEGGKTLRNLKDFIDEGLQVVVCEPGCASALTDDLPDLMEDGELAKSIQENVMMIDIFLDNEIKNGNLDSSFTSDFSKILLHGHCHQKSLYGTTAMERILQSIPGLELEVLDAGCCGMAGSFGYEKEHYELSMKVGEDRLFPAIRQEFRHTNPEGENTGTPYKSGSSDTGLVACGFSCRHQISDATNVDAMHWVEVLRGSQK